MKFDVLHRAAFRLYDWGWSLAIPLLKRRGRLADGFERRAYHSIPDQSMDLWIHAASAGEAYLVWELIKRLNPSGPIRLLLTTNTKEGLDILNRGCTAIRSQQTKMAFVSAYLPFDKPSVMEMTVQQVRPRVMVLLETELWPGLLSALKNSGCKRMIINGRITPKSLRSYLIISSFWRSLRPDAVFATSEADAQRFAILFKGSRISLMPNMKFDRIEVADPVDGTLSSLKKLLPAGCPFLVLGSIRKEEEIEVDRMITKVFHNCPEVVIGLFPRHLQRVDKWETRFRRRSFPYVLRSKTDSPVLPGTLILWDTFSELAQAYALAKAAFVGGSLAPLGGQNFIEALACGVTPVIGPYWDNFKWIGQEVIEEKLVRQAGNWEQAAGALIDDIHRQVKRETVSMAALDYIRQRQGGTDQACREILRYLKM